MSDIETSPPFSPLSDTSELFDAPTPQCIGLDTDNDEIDEMDFDSTIKPDNKTPASNNKNQFLDMTQFDHNVLSGVHGEEIRNLASSYFEAKHQILEYQQSNSVALSSPATISPPNNTALLTAIAVAATTITPSSPSPSVVTTSNAPSQPRRVKKEDKVWGCKLCDHTVQYDREKSNDPGRSSAQKHVKEKHPKVRNPASEVREIGRIIRYTDGTAELRYTAGDVAGQVVPVNRYTRRNRKERKY